MNIKVKATISGLVTYLAGRIQMGERGKEAGLPSYVSFQYNMCVHKTNVKN